MSLSEDDLLNTRTIKCMLVGDSKTGKTNLYRRLLGQQAPDTYIPTVFEILNKEVALENESRVSLTFWDSAGSHAFDSIRPISYAHTDCFMLCFALDDRCSFEQVTKRWLPEILKHGDGPRVPIILIANKCDLRDEAQSNNELVSREEGENLQAIIGARDYIECSGLTGISTDGILHQAAQLGCMKIAEEENPADPIWKFQYLNVVVVGDTGVGKSSLIRAVRGNQSEIQLPGGESNDHSFSEEFFHDTVVDGCEYFLRITEANNNTTLQKALQELCESADVVILCYAINDPFSFQSIDVSWNRTSKLRPKPQRTILIGTKSDLKEASEVLIPNSDGKELMFGMRCTAFIECSAKTLDNISQLLSTIINSVKED